MHELFDAYYSKTSVKRKRQIKRDEEKENRAGWSQEKPSGAVNYMDLIMEPLRLAVM